MLICISRGRSLSTIGVLGVGLKNDRTAICPSPSVIAGFHQPRAFAMIHFSGVAL